MRKEQSFKVGDYINAVRDKSVVSFVREFDGETGYEINHFVTIFIFTHFLYIVTISLKLIVKSMYCIIGRKNDFVLEKKCAFRRLYRK